MSLKAENLSFSYENGGRHVLTRISLKIEPGERVGLVAPSGYGKTTLCRLLAGYERPEAGTVEIDSIPIENIRGCMPVQLIWQHPEQAINPRWRMRQVLSEGGQVDEESRGRLGIREEWLDRFPSELSGGELQRFCIARALAANPRYLLADEITAMFDAVTQSQIWQALLHEAKEREHHRHRSSGCHHYNTRLPAYGLHRAGFPCYDHWVRHSPSRNFPASRKDQGSR